MQFRDRLLELLRRPDYTPQPEPEIARAFRLDQKGRRLLGAEIRRLLAAGEVVHVKGDRLCLPRAADLVTGRIVFRQGGSAFVVPEARPGEPEKEAVQVAAEDTGVAMHGDTVVVRLLAHRAPPPRRAPGRKPNRADEPRGCVIRILARGRTTLTGSLQRSRLFYFVLPDDPRFIHDIYVPDPAKSALRPAPAVGDKVVVQLHEWTQRHANPEGEITQRLGRANEPRAELAAIYHNYGLATDFPADVEREAAALPARVRPAELAGRSDYREVPAFTIDPDDAKDFDDALSVETLPNGDLRVGVHIADVSAYVRPGTALDREAQTRGNSTYLVGVVIPMLPPKLSNGLCSLVEAEDRLTKAVLLTYAPDGRLKQTDFANTVIRSRKRLTYRQAFALLKTDRLADIRRLSVPPAHQTGSTGRALASLSDSELADLQNWIRRLWRIAARLRRDRLRAGSLDLDMPETKIFVDAQGYADRLEVIENDESHQLIEEFMLAANEAVARLTKNSRLPSLYRVHDEPDDDRLQELRELLATAGIHVGDLTQRAEMTKLLGALRTHPQGYTLRTQVLRSLKRACYRATPDGHYGLAKKDYTHFTSPIRRYSDLVVHRVFDACLARRAGRPAPAHGYTAAKMASLAEHLSLTEENSTEAERESVKVKLVEFFDREAAKKKRAVFAAVITDLRNHGFFIELTESMTFGFVHLSSLQDDFYTLTDDGTALVGRRSRRRFALGQKLDVVVARVDRHKRQIDFQLAP